jgi:putative ABC transport system permease protein
MFQNYLKLALRNFRKNRIFSIINLTGLAVGLAAAIAVLLYVQDEMSYENCHEKADRIVRIETAYSYNDNARKLGEAPNVMAPFLKDRLPEAEAVTRVFPNNFSGAANVRAGNNNYAESSMHWADPNVAELFTFRMAAGDAATALTRPNTAMLSASTARRYFGNVENAAGKTIRIDNYKDLEITGVFEDFPEQTHVRFDILGAFQSINFGKPENVSWGNASFYNFLLLRPGTDRAAVESKIAELVKKDAPADRNAFTFTLKALRDIHLYSAELSSDDLESYGDIGQVRILIGLAVLLLLIACINYMNLATAQSQRRAKEVGLSKTLGANMRHMALKFYIETALLALFGIGGSIVLLWAGLPFFNDLADKQLNTGFLLKPWFWAGIGGIWALVTLVAGAYPAIFLSSFSPLRTLRQSFSKSGSGAGVLRKGLVVFQFCISTALIVSTLIFYRQLNFIRDKKLGYTPEQVVAVDVSSAENREQAQALETELAQLAFVRNTARSQTFPGREGSGRSLSRASDDDGDDLTTCRARPEIFEVLGLSLLAGQPMSRPREGDTITQIVLNRSAVEYLGWTPEQAIGRQINADLQNGVVVGVVENFHYGSMHQRIGAYAFHNARTEGLDFLLVKVQTPQLATAMRELEAAFKRTMTGSAFDYVFLDDHLDKLYRREQRMASVALLFAGLAIFIAALGLFALAAFAAERRTKEIGIRKVLGANVAGITGLLAKDFLKLVLIGIACATPVAWWVMERWLSDFAYRIDIQAWMFVAAGAVAITVALLTVSFQSVKAALVNPVRSLRSE